MNELLEIISRLDEEQQERLLQMAKDILAHTPFVPTEEAEDKEGEPVPSPYYDVNQLSYSAEDIRGIIDKFPKNKKWTFADLQNTYIFPAECGVKIELLNHKMYISEPTTSQQFALTNVATYLTMHTHTQKIGISILNFVLKINESNVLKPNFLYFSHTSKDKNLVKVQAYCLEGAPELVVEVISPANYKKLRNAKKKRYAQAGVIEYWELKPKKKSITVEILENGEYKLFSEAKKTGTIQSHVLQGFSLDIERFFV